MALYLGSNKWSVYLSGNAYHPNCYIRQLINDSDIPDYVKIEALELYEKVQSVKKDDSIIFLAMSDSHYPAEQTATTSYNSNVQSTIIANQAAKTLVSSLDFDFFAHLGDISCGASTTTPDMLESQINGFLAYFREAKGNLPVFLAIGNHDNGVYYHKTVNDGTDYIMSNEYMYNNFTARSASANTVMGNTAYGGYCYRDFNDKKLRVFLLNTCEESMYYRADRGATLGSQRVWLANALLNLNSKSDASEWSYIVLSHYPADYGATMPLSELFKAYVDGSSITISVEDGTSSTISFSGKNKAKFVSQFHGHVHNFKTSKLYSYATGSGVQYDAHRICIPNVQFDRENYYTTVGSYTDINFAEDTNYTKTANTANGTSFVVNVINPSEEMIYSFCYGAGYDRVVGYGSVSYHTVTRKLSNVSTNSEVFYVADGESYSETITLSTGYEMKSISVTMGGVDVSSTAISLVDGKYQISISSVTGNVVITAKASLRPNFTNLVPLSINSDGSDYYVDGDGYDNDVYINSSGTLSARAGCTTTGFIPVKSKAKTIRVAGEGLSINDTYTRFAYYDSNFAFVACTSYQNLGVGDYQGVLTEEDSTLITWTMDDTDVGNAGVYLRVCIEGDGADLIVTVDEEITYGGTDVTNYTVAQNLANVTSDNSQAVVTSGGSFSTTLAACSGYELSSVTVTMGGLDITTSAYSNGVITISNVTGNIVITAIASVIATSYTNQLTISTDTDGTVYNGTGYKADSYLSSGNVGTKSGYYTTGFIPIKYGDTLYFKNCTIQAEQSYHRFAFYDSNKTYLSGRQHNTTSSQLGSHTTPIYGTDGNMTTLNIDGSYWSDAAYIRFCCSYLGEDSIVTVNEPIN